MGTGTEGNWKVDFTFLSSLLNANLLPEAVGGSRAAGVRSNFHLLIIINVFSVHLPMFQNADTQKDWSFNVMEIGHR